MAVQCSAAMNRVVESLARHTRLVVWDKRGTGLSDPVMRVPTLDERMDHLHAVLDAVHVDRPALLGVSEGEPMTILFAATYPERVRSVVLYGTAGRFTQELPDFPWGLTPTAIDRVKRSIDAHWGEGRSAKPLLGDAADVPRVREMGGQMGTHRCKSDDGGATGGCVRQYRCATCAQECSNPHPGLAPGASVVDLTS